MALPEYELQQQLSALLPLNDGEISQIISQASSLPEAEGTEYLSSLVGETPDALRFIATFKEYRQEVGGENRTMPAANQPPAYQPPPNPPPPDVKNPLPSGPPPNDVKHPLPSGDSKSHSNGVPASGPPAYAPPPSAPPAASRASARHHTNVVIEAGKVRARDEVR